MDADWRQFYKINRVLMKSVGLWPSRHSILSKFYRAFMYFVLVSGVFAQFAYIIRKNASFNTVLSVLSTCIPTIVLLTKYICYHFRISALEPLIDILGENWDAVVDENSKEILAHVTRFGRLCTVCLTILFYTLIPTAVVLLHVPYQASNQSEPKPSVILADYVVFEHKHHYVMIWHMTLVILVGLNTILATESFTMVLVEHACGLYRVAGYQLSNAVDDTVLRIPESERDTQILNRLANAVQLHLRAIEFSGLIWSTFAMSYMLLTVPGIVSFSINLFRLSQLLTRLDQVIELFIIIVITVSHLLYMFLCCLFGQRLIDHSSDVFHQTYDSRWYETSVLVQKLYLFVLHRSLKYSVFVSAGIFVVSLEGFTTLCSMALSYYVMLHSLQ